MQINWDSFKVYDIDSRGIRFKFEDLCRILFFNEYLSENKQSRHLHSNPNNPGLETEPVFDEQNKQWIGFQAKYFENDVDYDQIKHSANQIIAHYTGRDGFVDLVYLFSNKPISSKAKGYIDTVNLLSKHNIDVQLITDDAILDLVRNKYTHLGLYFFGNHTLSMDWFSLHTNLMLYELGERYNRNFNIETTSLNELSLFLHDQAAADYLNNKKKSLLIRLSELLSIGRFRTEEYLMVLKSIVGQLPDVNIDALHDAIGWKNTVMQAVASFHEQLNKNRDKRSEMAKRQNELAINFDEKERTEAYNRYYELIRQINEIDTLIHLPDIIAVSDRERQLIDTDIMILKGGAGTGKTQLLANKTKALIDQGTAVLLLPAGIFFSDDAIQKQIMNSLHLGYSLEELIDILQTIGERDNRIIPICIDALNETWNYKLWKTGLPYIIDVVKKAPMVKLVVSYRTEYEPSLLAESLVQSQKSGGIAMINHNGFEKNSGIAVKEFLKHYNIPFSPLEYFRSEMTNPLFLTLYCKTYNGEEVSLPALYERLIGQVNSTLFHVLKLHEKGFTENDDVLRPLIGQMAALIVLSDRKIITQQQLSDLRFWKDYGLYVVPYINQLVKEGLLHDLNVDDGKVYYFAYDQMNDYYCAKSIIDSHSKKKDVRKYITMSVLNIKQGKLGNYGNIDLFVNICALYAEKFGEECIDIIDEIKDKEDQWQIFRQYIYSFQWRDPQHISRELLYDLLSKYYCQPDDLWPMLIGNSIKVQHPLNADYLHEFLLKYKLNRRDYLWTIYINQLTMEEENRVVQLIQMYDRGEKLEEICEKQIELLLTLFGWLLTSSNRWLRDYTSKAMIEILKNHFQLCQHILEKFKDVNDPYVIQRLYGIVFGACCKRTDGDYQSLAEYVYETVFNQEKVYPDILLRDYARLIIERYIWENPSYSGIIDPIRIAPPYISDPIPEIEDQHYEDKHFDNAIQRMVLSMRTADYGWYGDFGRYVFQSAISNFEVDTKQMFNYAVYYILNELGLNDEYFSEHDRNCVSYDRSKTRKTERIGKKYQWIAMYNMLARISDNCKMIDRWHSLEEKDVRYEGAWEPYVRDFDPTLNTSFMVCRDAPLFCEPKEHIAKGIEENRAADISSENSKHTWLERNSVFFDDLKCSLILTDEKGYKWISLTKYCDTRQDGIKTDKLLVWSWLYAYFVTPEQAKELSSCYEKGFPIINDDSASHHETYTVFNREYPWSPSCRSFEEYARMNLEIETDEVEKVQAPDNSIVEEILQKYCILLDENDKAEIICEPKDSEREYEEKNDTEGYRDKEKERPVKKDIGKALHATTSLLWEEQYDATKETSVSWSVPCGELIKTMDLRQRTADGFYYDPEGYLAAFDMGLTQKINSVVVRKDILDSFLAETGLKLVWLIDAEKEIIAESNDRVSAWSEWEGFFVYEEDRIDGEIKRVK